MTGFALKVNGEEVWHSADAVRSVSLRGSKGEAGLMRLDPDQSTYANIIVQTRNQSDLDTASEDNTQPSANAGDDLTCVNAETVTMTGTGSEGTGSETYLWTQVSGPTTPVLTNSTTATCTWPTHATTDGTYVFKLTVTDSTGRTAHDLKTVVVA